MNLTRFFNALYDSKAETNFILVWIPTEKGGKSFWYKDIKEAVRKISKNKDRNIYFQVGTAGRSHGPHRRCSSLDDERRPIVMMPALFCDIDIKDPVHTHKNLPKTEEEALTIIKGYGYDPSVIVNSGHGLQAYWIFKEPWDLVNKDMREACKRLLIKLRFTLKENARKAGIVAGVTEGWHVDSVQDIARVLRPPGSRNWKDPLRIRKVKVIEENIYRYNPDDLDNMLIDMSMSDVQNFVPQPGKIPQAKVVVNPPVRDNDGKIVKPKDLSKLTDDDIKNQKPIKPLDDGSIVLDMAAEPPFDKFQAFAGIDTTFATTWHGNNPALVDKSQSSFDMSLCHQVINLGWNDQEVANLIIANRRLHNKNPEKALRKDYIINTIMKCRSFQEKKSADKLLETASQVSGTKYQDILTKTEIKKSIKAKHGIEILDIVKYMGDEPSYEIYTRTGTVKLKNTEELIRPVKLQARVSQYLKFYMPYDKKKWKDTATQLLILCRDEKMSEDDDLDGRVRNSLNDYLEEAAPNMTMEKSVHGKLPFIHDNHWHVNFDKFYLWMKMYRGEEEKKSEVRKSMIKSGCRNKRYNVLKNSQGSSSRTTLRVMKVPNYILTDALASKGFTANPGDIEPEPLEESIH